MSYENEMLTMQDGSIQSVYNLTPDSVYRITVTCKTLFTGAEQRGGYE